MSDTRSHRPGKAAVFRRFLTQMAMQRRVIAFVCSGAISIAAMPGSATAQTGPANATAPAAPPSSYADVADFAVDSGAIIDARIRRVREVEPERAPGLPANLVRFYVEADVNTVIYGRNPVAARIAYILDQPRRPDGRAPRIRRDRVLLFARPPGYGHR
jgi:hypothetical protein